MSKTIRLDSLIKDLRAQRDEIDRKLAALYTTRDVMRERRDYDEDQPRDEQGRWSSSGGGGGVDRAERALTGAGSSARPSSGSKGPSKGLKEIGERLGKSTGSTGLHQAHDKYFNTDKPGTKVVPVDKLLTIRARSKGIENAEKYMANAYKGEGAKRDPISVSENPDGTYSVEDGNSTTAIARKHGWTDLPVQVVPASDKGKEAFKEHKTKQALEGIKALQDQGKLPKDVPLEKHREIAEQTLAKHQENLPRFRDDLLKHTGARFEGRTKELDSAIQKVVRKPKYGTVDKLGDLTGVRTVTKSVDETRRIVDALKKNYEVTETTDYLEKPNEGGYRAYHLNIKDKDGLVKEVQIQTERQRAFQKWSHDVYKPQTEEQFKAVGTKANPGPHREEALAYGDAVSQHYYNLDSDKKSKMPPPPSAAIRGAFGIPDDV